ncbi:type I restriction-modification system subunit M [Acinetobacter sp. HY1485]|uniref:type I restriction-modification system subunit M n=1 Tax=Acinetobacter sp. HY1485 TaxID=2970918 RepID=UPI0022B964EE|nr:class I SAM-dependent DNA methyltransferase [Acinetobacter sp. HY1485]
MVNNNFAEVASLIWSVADLLRGDFKQSQYGRIILPFTLLRRLECVLAETKPAVLEEYLSLQEKNAPEIIQNRRLLTKSGASFYNTSQLSLATMGQADIQENLKSYIKGFSKNAYEIFELFNFEKSIELLNDANLLFKVVGNFASIDLSPTKILNHEMGLVFEELIRKFAESSNETAGEHFTPRDIVNLTTGLVFKPEDISNQDGAIRTIYDPTAGTGGFLSSGMEYLSERKSKILLRPHGQELNPESYAICKADMLIKGQDVDLIKLGNTLSNDQLENEKFDYMLSNPPFGVDWKKIEQNIKDEHAEKGFEGRFGAGLPRVSDGSLLFLMHLISKLPDEGGRIGIILNGSPLFTGSAGSGESEIRRHILENDLLEAIVALPNDMFYNTGIATYVWILSNKKDDARKGKVQLINGSNLSSKMRKSLGSKRNYLTKAEIETIIQNYSDFEAVDILADDGEDNTQKPFSSKIFNTYEFGYRRVTIERPLRLSACISNEAIKKLRFSSSKPLNDIMQAVYAQFGTHWTDDNREAYGDLTAVETDVRLLIKAEFDGTKEKDIKDILNADTWITQLVLMDQAKLLQGVIGTTQHDDFNTFDPIFKKAIKQVTPNLNTKDKKQILDVITWINPEAEPVISKVLKDKPANPLYGVFNYKGQVVEFSQDGNLRDAENIALNPSIDTAQMVEDYFKQEVQPHVADAWINATKCDAIDSGIGIVGYEIPFNRHFYVYQPPRDLAEIDADLDKVTQEIMQLLQEVHV